MKKSKKIIVLLIALFIIATCASFTACSNKDYDMSGVLFSDVSYVYDGTEKKIEISGILPEGVSVTYLNNTLTNAGSIVATAIFTGDSENYNPIPPRTATLTIEKATYDMSDVKFEDDFWPFDGKPHSLVISGPLPEGVTVEYTENTLTSAGTLSVTATFTGDSENYNAIPSKTAVLTVVDDGNYHSVYFKVSATQTVFRIVKDGDDVIDVPEVEQREGYIATWDQDLSSVTSDMTVNPVYTVIPYSITYILNDGTNSAKNPTTYTVETPTIVLSSPIPKNIGYTFAGWFTTNTFDADSRVYSFASGTTGNKVLYAKWIRYCIESAEGFTFDYENYELPAVTTEITNTKTLLPLSSVIQVSEGCTWKLSNDIEGTEIITTKNISLQLGHNIKYITVWYNSNSDFNLVYILDVYRLDKFKYVFKSDGETYRETVEDEENSMIAEPPTPTKTGYTFLGWLANGETDVATFPYKLTEDTSFVASFEETITSSRIFPMAEY